MLLIIILILILIIYFGRKILPFIQELYFPPSAEQRLKLLMDSAKQIPLYKLALLTDICFTQLFNLGLLFDGDIPNPMTKTQLMRDVTQSIPFGLTNDQINSFLKTDQHLFGDKIIATTSGTSGEMGIFIHTIQTWLTTQAVLFKKMIYPHITKFIPHILGGIRAVFIIPKLGHFMSKKLPVPLFGLPLVETIFLDMNDTNLINKINYHQPHIIYSFPSVYSEISVSKANLNISPILIITGAEKLEPFLRSELQKRFVSSQIIETYACGECVFLGTSCKYGNIHINTDVCIVEAIDQNKNVITEKGIISDSIYVTNLVNTYQPIIRYEINDSIEYIDCSCQSTMPAICVHGRQGDKYYFIDLNGNFQTHTALMIKTIFVSIPYRFSYQLIHLYQNHLVIIIHSDHIDIELLERKMENYKWRYCISLTYEIKLNYPFILEKSGKMRQMI